MIAYDQALQIFEHAYGASSVGLELAIVEDRRAEVRWARRFPSDELLELARARGAAR